MDDLRAEEKQQSNAARPMWAVVPAGGSGTRLWPLSREARPKFLLPLLSDQSLLQETIARVAPLTEPARTLVVCGSAHVASVSRQLPQIPAENFLVEPAPRGTGPAIGLAAAIIHRREPTAIMGSFAADHAVVDPVALRRALDAAMSAAAEGWLVTIGLQPSRPETGYGYIERTDDAVGPAHLGSAYRAERFVEKPDLATASEYLRSGRFLWNASMFIWRVDALMAEMQRLQPDLYAGLSRIAAAWGTVDQERVLGDVWPALPASTIDQGIMERADRVAVVPVDCGWSDIGDWNGLGDLIEEDGIENRVAGDLVAIDTTRSVVWSETNRAIGLLALDNLVVVDTEDALLVADRSHAQDVRRIVERFKRNVRPEVT